MWVFYDLFYIGKLAKALQLSLWYGLAFIVKSKMEKQDLQAGESQLQNSNSTTS